MESFRDGLKETLHTTRFMNTVTHELDDIEVYQSEKIQDSYVLLAMVKLKGDLVPSRSISQQTSPPLD